MTDKVYTLYCKRLGNDGNYSLMVIIESLFSSVCLYDIFDTSILKKIIRYENEKDKNRNKFYYISSIDLNIWSPINTQSDQQKNIYFSLKEFTNKCLLKELKCII